MAIFRKAKHRYLRRRPTLILRISPKFIVSLTAGCCIVSRKHKGHDFWNYFLLGQTIPKFILQQYKKKSCMVAKKATIITAATWRQGISCDYTGTIQQSFCHFCWQVFDTFDGFLAFIKDYRLNLSNCDNLSPKRLQFWLVLRETELIKAVKNLYTTCENKEKNFF